MGNHLSILSERGEFLDSVRIGSNGSAPFLVEQWIAGYSISHEADKMEARKIRQHWLRHTRRMDRETPLEERLYNLAPRENTIRALQDNTEGCAWVRVEALDRKLLRGISCPRLSALVALWHMADTYYDLHPVVRITESLVHGVRIATNALEEIGAAYAERARECADPILGAGEGSRLSIG